MKTINRIFRITAVEDFNPSDFLSTLFNSGISATLLIEVDGRTKIFLILSGTISLFDKEDELKLSAFEDLLEGCSFEEGEPSEIREEDFSIIHITGEPSQSKSSMEKLITKLLETGISSRIFVNVEPLDLLSPSFYSSFSIVLSSDEEDIATLLLILRTIFGNSINITIDRGRRARHNLKKLIEGKQIHTTILNEKGLSTYFYLPMTYGIEPIKKMNFPMPTSSFEGMDIGRLAEYKIGEIEKIRLEPSRLFEHMAIWGASGSGKTTFIKNLLIELSHTDVKFCVIDWHNEYRDVVCSLDGKIGEDILVFNPMIIPFSLNSLEIPETENREIIVWERIENFVSLIKQMFKIGEIQEGKLRRALMDLYSTSNNPTIGRLIAELKDKRMGTLVYKLEKFTTGFYGKIFNTKNSTISLEELKKKNVIFELGGLPGEVRTFFVYVLLILWWDHLRLGNPSPNVLILDDFQRYSEHIVVRKMLSEARKFKQGIICSHQGPYQLSEMMRAEVVRNTATKVIFRQEQTWDKYIVRDALGGLDKEQLINLSYLDTGEAIVKLPSVKFPVRVNTYPPPQGQKLQDWEIREAMKNYSEELPQPETPENKPMEKEFLKEIYKDPYVSVPDIAKHLGMKTKRCYDLKQKLVRTGYLHEEKIRVGRGRPRKVLKLTEKGLEALNQKGKSPAHQGGPEHIYLENRIASILRKNWIVRIERGCDVRAEKDNYKVAIEIETGKSNRKEQILYNVKRDLRWADKVVVVCPNKNARLKINEMLAGFDRVVIITYSEVDELEDFLNET
ncbi:MAG: DUF87 domain-containing protein [Candidatus Aenigmarchaeota archaeon]|nr:DUF87 domain-containing protein [Candidatus Aenigmarchaeota archaeon]